MNNQYVGDALQEVCASLIKEFPDHEMYINLQATWNREVLEYSARWMPKTSAKIISIGSFLGAPETVLAKAGHDVLCCDMADFLPSARHPKITFHKSNLDAPNLNLPDDAFDACFIVEVLEHLRWSPVPLLTWVRDHCNLLVITTPDDVEWAPVEEEDWTTREHFRKIPAAVPGAQGNPQPMNHCKQYSQSEFVELLDAVGFRVVEMQRVGGGGHQMLLIAQVRIEERYKTVTFEDASLWKRVCNFLFGPKGAASA